MKVELTPAYILHTRPFRDSSAIVECLSHQQGLISLIARGAKRPRSQWRGLIQPFIPLQMSWIGHSELKTLTHVEAEKICPKLSGSKILLGLYLNELLMRLLQRFDPHPQLYHDYDAAISAISVLQNNEEQQFILRQFELKLLAELGYGLDLSCDAKTLQKLEPELLYTYDPNIGIIENSVNLSKDQVVVSGASIIALNNGHFDSAQLREMKKLMRLVLAHHLGNKSIQSRKLFNPSQKAVPTNEE